MTIKLQLPSDNKEALFVLELLKKLNLIYEPQDEVVIDKNSDMPEALKTLLQERIADMEAHPHDVISWADIQKRDKLQTAML